MFKLRNNKNHDERKFSNIETTALGVFHRRQSSEMKDYIGSDENVNDPVSMMS